MNIKEESGFLNFCSENERELFNKDLVKKVKHETVTSGSYIKPEPEEESTCCSENEDHPMRFNETIKESEIETKIDIKEEPWCLEREDSCINNDIKYGTHADFYSTKPPSLYKEGVSSFTSDLLSSENLGDDMNKDSPESGSGRKCQSVVTDTSSIETNVCSETSDDGKIVSVASSLKQSTWLQQSNTNIQDINKKSCISILSNEYSKSYKCDAFVNCSRYSSHLEKNRMVLDRKETSKLNVCDKGFNQFSALKTHKLIDEGKRTHICGICNKAFTQSACLKAHELIHKGIKPHKCDICGKAFTLLSGLKKHKMYHEGIKPHKCYICKKSFTMSSGLKDHILIHDGIKPHKCNICNRAFTQSSTLNAHKLIHESIKPHTCQICNKGFTRSSYLKTHTLIHYGIKPHKCEICNKTFTALSNLKTHKLSHSVIRPHKCNICDKSFIQLSTLKEHKRIHSIKSPKCNICNKTYTQLSSLKRHKCIQKVMVLLLVKFQNSVIDSQ